MDLQIPEINDQIDLKTAEFWGWSGTFPTQEPLGGTSARNRATWIGKIAGGDFLLMSLLAIDWIGLRWLVRQSIKRVPLLWNRPSHSSILSYRVSASLHEVRVINIVDDTVRHPFSAIVFEAHLSCIKPGFAGFSGQASVSIFFFSFP